MLQRTPGLANVLRHKVASSHLPALPLHRPCVRAVSMAAGNQGPVPKKWEIRMLYDGDCPLCKREVNFLMSRDADKGKIDFVDISSPSYNPEDNKGLTYEQAMERIHAITAEGEILRDIAVFRRLYQAVGLGWVYAITENPTIEALANKVYGFWAKYRMEVTGRESLPTILERHRQNRAGISGSACNDNNTDCPLPQPKDQKFSNGSQ